MVVEIHLGRFYRRISIGKRISISSKPPAIASPLPEIRPTARDSGTESPFYEIRILGLKTETPLEVARLAKQYRLDLSLWQISFGRPIVLRQKRCPAFSESALTSVFLKELAALVTEPCLISILSFDPTRQDPLDSVVYRLCQNYIEVSWLPVIEDVLLTDQGFTSLWRPISDVGMSV